MMTDSPDKWYLLQKGFRENGWQDPKCDKELLKAISHNLKDVWNEFTNWKEMCKIKKDGRKGCAGC